MPPLQLYVFVTNQPVEASLAVEREFPDRSRKLTEDGTQWLLVGEGTARDVSNRLGVTKEPPEIGNGIVFTVAGYYGRTPQPTWEWLFTQLGGHRTST